MGFNVLKPYRGKAERRGWLGRAYWSMEVNTASVSGFLRFWMLAKLRRWRPRSHRYLEEQREIDAWLALIAQAAASSPALALEIAECARLIKGYGDTHKRGTANYREIERHVIRPALAGEIPPHGAVELFLIRARELGADFSSDPKYPSLIVTICRALDGIHGRHTQFNHSRKFLCNWFCPREPSYIGTEDNFYVGFQSFLE